MREISCVFEYVDMRFHYIVYSSTYSMAVCV